MYASTRELLKSIQLSEKLINFAVDENNDSMIRTHNKLLQSKIDILNAITNDIELTENQQVEFTTICDFYRL